MALQFSETIPRDFLNSKNFPDFGLIPAGLSSTACFKATLSSWPSVATAIQILVDPRLATDRANSTVAHTALTADNFVKTNG